MSFGRGWFTHSAILACALVGFAGATAHAADPAPQRGQQGKDGQVEQQGPMYGGGTYDNLSIEDDWFYDTYSTKKGFGADYYAQDNIVGTYDDRSMTDDWYFDQYEVSNRAGPGRIGTPRPGRDMNPMPGRDDASKDAPNQGQDQQGQNRSDFQGKVEAIKQVGVMGGGDEHVVVLLSEGDARYVVDLGPAKALTDLQIQVGEALEGQGKLGRVGDRVVVFADALTRQGKEITIRQDLQLQSVPLAREPAKSLDISGEILKLKDVTTEGGQSNTVALVAAADGKQMAVDLGPSDTFGSFGINVGDTLQVTGRLTPIGEHLVLWAEQIDVKGTPVNLRGVDAQPNGRPPRGTR